jgi:hypothetical protein
MTPGAAKPVVSASMTAKVNAARAAAPSTAPEISTRRASGSALSGSSTAPAISAARPSARLNQKMPRQFQAPTRAPPMTGPAASASPDTAVHTPTARVRARSSSYTCRSIDRVPGSQAAAPRPMTARAAISAPEFGARAASTDPAQKIPTPISMTFLRPNSSATMPKASMAPANVSAYALTTHCNAETPVCNSAWTLPRATLTTVLSRKVRNRIVHSTASASGRLRPAMAGRPTAAGILADEVTG